MLGEISYWCPTCKVRLTEEDLSSDSVCPVCVSKCRKMVLVGKMGQVGCKWEYVDKESEKEK